MKNLKKYIIACLATVLLVQSCREEYLNEPAPTTAVSSDVVFGSKEGTLAYIAGILRRTRGQYTSTDSGNLGSMYFARENKGNNSVNAGSWFGFDYAHDNREPNYRRTTFTWNFLYYLINQANYLIKGIEESTSLSSSEKNELLGQALAMRAYFYFELSLEFQHTYTYDPSLPAPPIYTEPNSLEGGAMSTQKEMYDFILADIEKSVSIGSSARTDKSYFNKPVAHAIAARVYQVMGNWPKAAEHARAAYGGNVQAALSPSFYQAGFDDMDEGVEWLLADPQTADQSNYYWLAPHGFYTRTESAYNNTYINRNFVAKFSDTDVRNTFKKTALTDFRQWYTTKFKFAFDADLVLIRTAEMILIEAEALYHTNPAAAHDLLYSLQKNRDVAAVKSTNSGAALLEEILLERQKELYGEIGVEWYDAKRLQRGLARDQGGVHRLPMTNNPLVANDKRFFLKIPQSEIDANPNIDASINDNR